MSIPTNFGFSKVSLQLVCQRMIPLDDQFPIIKFILAKNIRQWIAPLFPKIEGQLPFSVLRKPEGVIAQSMEKILIVWHSSFGLSKLEMNARLPFLKGELEPVIFGNTCRELNNILNAEKIYQTATNISAKDVNQVFWEEIKPLVERGISTEHACLIVLFTKYSDVDLSSLKTSNSFMKRSSLYRDLSMIFAQHDFWDLAYAAAKRCSILNVYNGAYNFRDLCRFALVQNDHKKAGLFQFEAQKFNSDAGGQALMSIIEKKIHLSLDLESVFDQIQPSLTLLLEIDREYGLRCLIAVAKKAVDTQKIDMALTLVARAFKEQQTRTCSRERNHSDDIDPYRDMAKYCVELKRYELSELFARKGSAQYTDLNWHLTHIVISKLVDEIVDYRLIDELHASRSLTKDLVLWIISVLLSQNYLNEARLLLIRQFEGLEEIDRNLLLQQLEKLLRPKGLEAKSWLKEAPEYSRVYSLNDALQEQNVKFLLEHKSIAEEAIMIYQKHIETPGVLDLLIEVANQVGRKFSLSILAIKGIGLALNIEALREQAREALVQLAGVQDRYIICYKLRVQARNELARRSQSSF